MSILVSLSIKLLEDTEQNHHLTCMFYMLSNNSVQTPGDCNVKYSLSAVSRGRFDLVNLVY